MTRDQAVLLALGGLALVCVVLAVVVVRVSAAARRGASELAGVRARVEDLEAQAARDPVQEPAGHAPAPAPVEYLITDLGHEQPPAEPARLDAPAFADIVVKETVVKAASLVHGVRRGLAPAARNRIRFEMKQEVRRSRKQRRSDLKAARRDLHARQRADLAEEAS